LLYVTKLPVQLVFSQEFATRVEASFCVFTLRDGAKSTPPQGERPEFFVMSRGDFSYQMTKR
jgi:hypothetical protein